MTNETKSLYMLQSRLTGLRKFPYILVEFLTIDQQISSSEETS